MRPGHRHVGSRLGGAFGLLVALGGAPRGYAAPPADPSPAPVPHLVRANELVGQNQLDAACTELAEEYASSHDPLLWLRIGRLRLRLQQPAAARVAMQRFIDESKTPHPALKAEAQRALYELRDVPAPPPPAALPAAIGEGSLSLYHDLRLVPVQIQRRRDRRLLKIGAGLLASGYLPALAVSLGLASSVGQPDAPSAAANYTLLIPVVGPLVSAVVAPATNEHGNGRPLISSWSLPWALTSGLLQVAGFAALVAGAIPRPLPVFTAHLQLVPYADTTGSGLLAQGSF